MSAAGAKILAAPISDEGHSARSFAKPRPTRASSIESHTRFARAPRIRVEKITAVRAWRVDDGWAARARVRLQTSSSHRRYVCMSLNRLIDNGRRRPTDAIERSFVDCCLAIWPSALHALCERRSSDQQAREEGHEG